MFTNGATFLNSIAVSWYLGKVGLGEFSLCLTAVLIALLLSDMGLNTIVLRDYSGRNEPASPSLRFLLGIRTLAASAVTVVIIAVGVSVFQESAPLVVAASLLILPRSISGVAESYLKARIQRRTVFAIALVSSILQILLVWEVAAGGNSLTMIFFVLAALEYGKSLILLLILRPTLQSQNNSVPIQQSGLRSVLVQGLPFAIIALLSLLGERADLFFLAALRGAAETGIYAGAERFLMLGNLFAFSFYGSALPVFSSFRGQADYRAVVRKTLLFALVLSSGAAFILGVGARLIIATTFRFEESVLLLRILAATFPGIVINSILRIALFSVQRERPVATVFVVAIALNTILNLIFIPRFGALAAAFIAVGTEYAIMFGHLRLYLSFEHDKWPSRNY